MYIDSQIKYKNNENLKKIIEEEKYKNCTFKPEITKYKSKNNMEKDECVYNKLFMLSKKEKKEEIEEKPNKKFIHKRTKETLKEFSNRLFEEKKLLDLKVEKLRNNQLYVKIF